MYHFKNCLICSEKTRDFSSEFGGGSGIKKAVPFSKHLKEKHNITIEEYIEKILKIEINYCKCGCNNKVLFNKCTGKFNEYLKGHRTIETMEKITNKNKLRVGDKHPLKNKKPWNFGLNKYNNEIVARIAKKQIGRKYSDATIEKIRNNTINNYLNGKFKKKETKPEKEFTSILKELNLTYLVQIRENNFIIDFYIPKYDFYIEVDGDYFHSNPKIYPNGPKSTTQKMNYFRDIKKNNYFNNKNKKLIRFWESDILNDKEKIKCKLRELFQLEK